MMTQQQFRSVVANVQARVCPQVTLAPLTASQRDAQGNILVRSITAVLSDSGASRTFAASPLVGDAITHWAEYNTQPVL